MATPSVFAKQFAKASAKLANAKAKAAPKAAAVTTAPRESKPNDDDGDGGVMNCANRDLLRQMLQGVGQEDDQEPSGDDVNEGDDDDFDVRNEFQMSLRHTPMPKAVQRAVPTISSPAGQRPMAGPSSVSAIAAVKANEPSRELVARASVAAASNARTIVAGPSIASAPSKSGPSIRSVVSGPVIATGPPRAGYVSQARPGSRGALGGGAPVAMMARPTTPGTPGGIGSRPVTPAAAPPASVAVRSNGYSGLYAARGATPTGPGVAKTAARPLCGPSAFEMLRKMESEKAADYGDKDDDVDYGEDDYPEHGDDGFAMPESDSERDAPAQASRMARAQLPVEAMSLEARTPASSQSAQSVRVPQVVSAPQASNVPQAYGAPQAKAVARAQTVQQGQLPTQVQQQISQALKPKAELMQESAADYVERVKRGLEVEVQVENVAVRDRHVLVEVEPQPQLSIPPTGPAPKAVAGSVRARSLDVRREPERVTEVLPFPARDIDDDESDDDDEGVARQDLQGMRWKANVKMLVQDFAREEKVRERGRRAGSEPRSKAQSKDEPDLTVSKKPRSNVEYTPATVVEYKHKYGEKGEYSEMGSLGPDLDDEQLLLKRAMQERVKQFSKELLKVNRHRNVAAPPKLPTPAKIDPKVSARAKAMEFAKHVPKPKEKPKVTEVTTRVPSEPADADAEQERLDLEEIRRREQQHFEDTEHVKNIKEFLNLLPF